MISSSISKRKGTEIHSRCLYCVKLCNLRLTLRRNSNFAILLFQLGKYFFLVGKIKTYYFPRTTFHPVFPFFLKQRRIDNNIVWNKAAKAYCPKTYAVPPPMTPPRIT